MDNTSVSFLQTLSYGGYTFNLKVICSDNPGIDGFYIVSEAPDEFQINGELFSNEDEIFDTIQENISSIR
ncbi:hypothetical protein ACOMCU_15800 [Lysinibacillus sp. UGB7]|uniref:hypothetical protein n=1 Tax=Lysinibacillus sp. UGB7 TaxID=3411039 RepID=UPI003B8028E5